MTDLRHTTTTSTVVSYSTSGERVHMQGAEQMEEGQSPRQTRRPQEGFGYQSSFNSSISRLFMVQFICNSRTYFSLSLCSTVIYYKQTYSLPAHRTRLQNTFSMHMCDIV